jgi:hypothetical protein
MRVNGCVALAGQLLVLVLLFAAASAIAVQFGMGNTPVPIESPAPAANHEDVCRPVDGMVMLPAVNALSCSAAIGDCYEPNDEPSDALNVFGFGTLESRLRNPADQRDFF